MYVLSKSKKNIKIFPMKISIFTGEKGLRILHGRVFVKKRTKLRSTIKQYAATNYTFKQTFCVVVAYSEVWYLSLMIRPKCFYFLVY